MGASNALRMQDIRAAFRLVGECRDLWDDSEQWRQHSFDGLCRLVGARVACGGEMRWHRPHGPIGFVQMLDLGWTKPQRTSYEDFMHNDIQHDRSVLTYLQKLTGRLVTRNRTQLLDDRSWSRSVARDYYRQCDVDNQIISLCEFLPGSINPVTLFRAPGEHDFSSRERRLVQLFHGELGRLIGPVLRWAGEPGRAGLSPRLRQTLDCLREGDSEKQVASRLGLSQVTIHQYVTALYRHFGVNSRPELLARFVRHPLGE